VSFIDPAVEAYAEAHAEPPGDVLERLAEETRAKTTVPQMMVGPIEGRFLAFLVFALRARRLLEIGTFTGYSSICMASALPSDGRIVTLDVNEETTEIARRYATEAGVIDRIEYRLGPGRTSFPRSTAHSTSSSSTLTRRATSTTTRRRCPSWRKTA
jgi:predicted O-methyltransferase YrrM